MLHDLIPAAAITVGPVLALAPVVYALRPQGGNRWLSPRPLPASAVLARLAHEVDTGEIPRDLWGGVDRESALTAADDIVWTSTAERDPVGVFPVVAVAR